jgi:hypothetical protein
MELMGLEEPKFLKLDPNCWAEEDRVSREDNDVLALSFTMEELEEVIKNTKTAMAPCPDGLPVAFFKNFCPLLKDLIFRILNGFAMGTLDISCLNFGILSLIPKVLGVESIKQYRPIALINVIFKFVSKAVANRLSPVANKIIAPTQTAFIKGRIILDGALSLHEIIHEIKVRKS